MRRDDVRHVEVDPAGVPGEVGVPGVRVQQVHPLAGGHHRQGDAHGLQRGVGPGQGLGHLMGVGVGARGSPALHVDVDELAQLAREVLDVNAGTAVGLRGPFPCQQSDSHARQPRTGRRADARCPDAPARRALRAGPVTTVAAMSNPRVLGIVLAGGEGKRLMPLTADRAKPAVPFGGSYRLIDFVLSNLVNAGFARIAVLTQYKSHSLDRHVTQTWAMPAILGDYVTAVPAQQRLGPRWYTGSADAIYQSMNLIEDEDPDYLLVFGADNIYRMDPRQMLEQHIDTGAAVTVAGIRKPRSEASEFGVIEQDADSTKIDGVPREAGRPAGRARLARTSRSSRWATTSSPATGWSTRCAPTPPTTPRCTTWAATSSRR